MITISQIREYLPFQSVATTIYTLVAILWCILVDTMTFLGPFASFVSSIYTSLLSHYWLVTHWRDRLHPMLFVVYKTSVSYALQFHNTCGVLLCNPCVGMCLQVLKGMSSLLHNDIVIGKLLEKSVTEQQVSSMHPEWIVFALIFFLESNTSMFISWDFHLI